MLAQPFTIHQATADDVTFLRKMMWEAILASPALIKRLGTEGIQKREATYWQSWLIQPDPAFVAVDAKGQAVGAIVLQPNDPLGWRIGIGVEANVRGQGIGKRLIEQAIAFVAADNAAPIYLTVDPDNTRALSLYEHMEFIRIGTRNSLIEMCLDQA
jgi:ribosomal protein S18 acetylase RimI-like enzyme